MEPSEWKWCLGVSNVAAAWQRVHRALSGARSRRWLGRRSFAVIPLAQPQVLVLQGVQEDRLQFGEGVVTDFHPVAAELRVHAEESALQPHVGIGGIDLAAFSL